MRGGRGYRHAMTVSQSREGTVRSRRSLDGLGASISTASVYRAVHELCPTLLVDEADNALKDRNAKAELLGVLNMGYQRGKTVVRVGGPRNDRLDVFEVFCPKVICGLDDLPRHSRAAVCVSRCGGDCRAKRSPTSTSKTALREIAQGAVIESESSRVMLLRDIRAVHAGALRL